jgi:proline iminopeptidase
MQPGLDVLAVRHTLVYYDQRATGRSTSELTPEAINLEAFVEDIDAVRQAMGYDRINLLTHSFGALIGLEYAARHPENLRSLILLNPVEPGTQFQEDTSERQRRARTEADSVELAELTATEGFAARDAATLSQVFRVVFRQSLRDRARISELNLDLMQATAKNGQDVAQLLGGGIGPVDWWDRLPEIEAPTLVLHGRYDVVPVSMSSALAEVFPAGSLAVLDSGHFGYLEDPDGLLAVVSGFIAGLDR